MSRPVRPLLRRGLRLLALALFAALLLSVLAVLGLRYLPPLTTMFILDARTDTWFDDEPGVLQVRREWRALDKISPQLQLAVIAAEDQRFPEHNGFDFKQIRKALDEAENGGRSRGASTISQQVAKNCSCGMAAAGCAKDWKPGSRCWSSGSGPSSGSSRCT